MKRTPFLDYAESRFARSVGAPGFSKRHWLVDMWRYLFVAAEKGEI